VRRAGAEGARRAKSRFCLAQRNFQDGSLASMVDADVDNVLDLFGIVNAGTHGVAGTYDIDALTAIKRRVEDAIRFLHVLLN
jgi:predicted pPIWI-associating nuclease